LWRGEELNLSEGASQLPQGNYPNIPKYNYDYSQKNALKT
jgi:hypothetical protein